MNYNLYYEFGYFYFQWINLRLARPFLCQSNGWMVLDILFVTALGAEGELPSFEKGCLVGGILIALTLIVLLLSNLLEVEAEVEVEVEVEVDFYIQVYVYGCQFWLGLVDKYLFSAF